MRKVQAGDRVQILCASRRENGADLESPAIRSTPYWIRAGDASATAANGAVVGMVIGERKTLRIEVSAGPMTMDIDIVEIRPAVAIL